MPRRLTALACATTMLAALAVAAEAARAQTPWYEGFEGPQPSWRPAGGDASFQVLTHRRVPDEAFTGQGCEHVAISAAGGTHVYFSQDVDRPRVIEELLPSVRVKSDRGGVQMLARIVLPRTGNPRTGEPVTTLVHGSSYTSVGRWQQLRIDDLSQQLARQTRVLRAELGPAVDPREAYLDHILLNLYSGPGVTNVWIDDLDIAGYVEAQGGAADRSAAARPEAAATRTPADMTGWTSGTGSHRAGDSAPPRSQLDGSVLVVDGRPFFPRIIQYRGESLGFLQRLGFNTVWLDELPTVEMLDEASRLGLWVICPPPRPSQLGNPNAFRSPSAPIGPNYERVLAWDLGQGLSADELDAVKHWAQRVRAADRQAGRPLICRPTSELRKYSQHVDILMIGRSPLGTSLELNAYGAWLRERPRLARPGHPMWTTVQTQLSPGILNQWAALGLTETLGAGASSEQIRLLTYTAVSAGVRGLLFESHGPLDAPDVDTRNRAMSLELLNLELTLIEPWVAAGDLVTTVGESEPEIVGIGRKPTWGLPPFSRSENGTVPFRSAELIPPPVLGGVLRTNHARLLVPIWSGGGAQFVPGQSAGQGVSLVVPGVPEASNAYLLMPGALEPLRHKRVTGGTRVTLEEFGLTSLVLFTGEPLVLSRLRQQADAIGRRAAQLQRDLAAAKLEAAEQAQRQLSPQPDGQPQSIAWLQAAQRSIQSSDAALAAGHYADAYRHAQRAMRPLRLLERAYWESAVQSLPSPVSNPLAVSLTTLPWLRTLWEQIVSAQPGPNLLHEGGFEDLDAMLSAGWLHFQHASPGICAEAELTSVAAHSGRLGVRLTASPAEGDRADVLVDSPPSSITSPAVPVEAGQMVCIHGWVHVPAPITGSVDGLLIIDSLSGEPLAERVGKTEGWQEFTLYRMPPEQGVLSVTFALSGLGEAWIDDVTIHTVPFRALSGTLPGISRLPAAFGDDARTAVLSVPHR